MHRISTSRCHNINGAQYLGKGESPEKVADTYSAYTSKLVADSAFLSMNSRLGST